jgi:hypothetical protein
MNIPVPPIKPSILERPVYPFVVQSLYYLLTFSTVAFLSTQLPVEDAVGAGSSLLVPPIAAYWLNPALIFGKDTDWQGLTKQAEPYNAPLATLVFPATCRPTFTITGQNSGFYLECKHEKPWLSFERLYDTDNAGEDGISLDTPSVVHLRFPEARWRWYQGWIIEPGTSFEIVPRP